MKDPEKLYTAWRVTTNSALRELSAMDVVIEDVLVSLSAIGQVDDGSNDSLAWLSVANRAVTDGIGRTTKSKL